MATKIPIPPEPSYQDLAYPTPVNPKTTNEALNLSVLQRLLPSTVSIEFLAPYAVVYLFSSTTSTQAWEKSGVEGTLFVVRLRNGRHAVVVLNRRGLDNFILHLKSAEEVDVTDEYIILRGDGVEKLGDGNGDEDEGKVYGLWIFEEELGSTKGVREACGKCILECAEKAEKQMGAGHGGSDGHVQQEPAASGPNLMALLNSSRGGSS